MPSDAEAAARESGDEAAEGRRHAEGHGIPSAVPQSPPQGLLPAQPLVRKAVFVPLPRATSHIAICEVAWYTEGAIVTTGDYDEDSRVLESLQEARERGAD